MIRNRGKTRRVCIESPEHKHAHISPSSYKKMLIFGKEAFFIMLFLITPNQIPHFRTLFGAGRLGELFSYIDGSNSGLPRQ